MRRRLACHGRTIDQVRVEHNVNFGIHVVDSARVSVTHSKVTGSGDRANPNANNTPNPGTGISYEGTATGTVAFTTVTGSAAAGIANETGNRTRWISSRCSCSTTSTRSGGSSRTRSAGA